MSSTVAGGNAGCRRAMPATGRTAAATAIAPTMIKASSWALQATHRQPRMSMLSGRAFAVAIVPSPPQPAGGGKIHSEVSAKSTLSHSLRPNKSRKWGRGKELSRTQPSAPTLLSPRREKEVDPGSSWIWGNRLLRTSTGRPQRPSLRDFDNPFAGTSADDLISCAYARSHSPNLFREPSRQRISIEPSQIRDGIEIRRSTGA